MSDKAGVFIVGCVDTSGKPIAYVASVRVAQIGSALRGSDSGMLDAVFGEDGNWYNPRMAKLGVMVQMMIEERDAEGVVTKRLPEGLADHHYTASPLTLDEYKLAKSQEESL